MGLFKGNGGNAQQHGRQMTPQQAWQQFQQNPVASLRKVGFNIPDGMNNGQEIMQHLVQTGQIPQGKLQQVTQMFGQMMGKR